MQVSPYVITISRQLGSGGRYLGKRIAERLGIGFVDRQILTEAAKGFKLTEGELEELEERTTPFWQSFLTAGAYTAPEVFIEPSLYYRPTDRELFEAESAIIERVAREGPSVIIGRCGSYVLKEHPRHLHVFVHAEPEFRLKRVQKSFGLDENASRELMEKTDKERAHYIKVVTGEDWKDVRQYHLSLDTGVMGLDTAEELILACVKARFGVEVNPKT
jgi:cytidylate kinase